MAWLCPAACRAVGVTLLAIGADRRPQAVAERVTIHGVIYRYGGISRSNAKDDTRKPTHCTTCNTPHVFAARKAEDKAALLKATVVKLGDPRFLELDAKYLSGCNNRHIKSAVPMIATMR
jgi:hypothetical protein